MASIEKKKLNMLKILKWTGICTVALIILITLFPASSTLASSGTTSLSTLDLRVDQHSHARVHYAGLPVIVSIGGFFEYFERNLIQGRKRLAEGPWSTGATLRKVSDSHYQLYGNDPLSNMKYSIEYRLQSLDTIELSYSFTTPETPGNLSFEILKLSGDLLKGATLSVIPKSLNVRPKLPLDPMGINNRILFTNKNKVTLESSLCKIDISDLYESSTISGADFRSVPWDKEKSFYIGVDANNLRANRTYHYKYAIRFSQAAGIIESAATTQTDTAIIRYDPWKFFSIPPKIKKNSPGHYQLQASDTFTSDATGLTNDVLVIEMKKITGFELYLSRDKAAVNKKGIHVFKNSTGLPPEGFEIDIEEQNIIVRGADDRGCLYGVYYLLGQINANDGKWHIPCQKTRDWPDLSVRAIQLESLKPAIRDVTFFKRYLLAHSKARVNTVIFFHEPEQVLSWQKNTDQGWWKKSQVKEIAAYAKSLHMDVWGGMWSKFDRKAFPQFNIIAGSDIYNPFDDNSYKLLFSLYSEIINTYQPPAILIGHDEIQGLSIYSEATGKSSDEVLASDIRKIHEWLSSRGIKTLLAGDMLLDSNKWGALAGEANSMNPIFNSGATHLAIDKIPKDVQIIDWHYVMSKDYPSIKYFTDKGFVVYGCSWHDPKATDSMVRSIHKNGGNGIVGTDFGFFSTLSPASTTLYASLLGWSLKGTVSSGDLDVLALADNLRTDDAYFSLKQEPLDISKAFNESTYSRQSGGGIFGTGPILDLRSLKAGKRYLGGILYDLKPAEEGQSKNCIVVDNADNENNKIASRMTLDLNLSCRALAFLHTSFVDEPQYRYRIIGVYKITYDDGTVEKIDLGEGWNITDVRSSVGLRKNDWTFNRRPDVLAGARLAWQGTSLAGIPLNLQTYIWNNPHPEKKIQTLEISVQGKAGKKRLVVLGLTTLN
jgi:hypothetical protein